MNSRFSQIPLRRFVLRNDYVPVFVNPNSLVFRNELRTVFFDKPEIVDKIVELAPLLKTPTTVADLVSRTDYGEEEIRGLLKVLDHFKLLEDVDSLEGLCEQERNLLYYYMDSGHLEFTSRSLLKARPWLIGTGVLVWRIASLMAECGIPYGSLTDLSHSKGQVSPAEWCEIQPTFSERGELIDLFDSHDLVICALDRIWQPLWESLNAVALVTRKPWLSVLVQADNGLLGPLVLPFESACFSCFDLRQRGNLASPEIYSKFVEDQSIDNLPNVPVVFAPLREIMASHCVLEIYRFYSHTQAPDTVGRVLEFRISDYRPKVHHVFKLPRCSSCSHKTPPKRAWDLYGISRKVDGNQ